MEVTHTRKTALGGVAVVAALLLVMLVQVPAVAVAQDNDTNVSDIAPYYENQTATPDVANWTDGRRDPTLANMTHYLSRIPSFVLGSGGEAQGGGSATTLVFSVLLLGGVIGVATGSGVGAVGGVVLGVVGVAGFASTALLPAWLYVVLLFVVGGALAAVAIRVWQ